MEVPLEDIEAKNLHTHLEYLGLWHTHVANERKSKPQHMKKLKDMGVSSGFPDFIVLVPTSQGLCTVFIELKRQKIKGKRGKWLTSHTPTKPQQTEWIDKLNECTATDAMVCYGYEEAIKYIEDIKKY